MHTGRVAVSTDFLPTILSILYGNIEFRLNIPLPENIRTEVLSGKSQYIAEHLQVHQKLLLELSSAIHSYVVG